jgi:hypothetical protein
MLVREMDGVSLPFPRAEQALRHNAILLSAWGEYTANNYDALEGGPPFSDQVCPLVRSRHGYLISHLFVKCEGKLGDGKLGDRRDVPRFAQNNLGKRPVCPQLSNFKSRHATDS